MSFFDGYLINIILISFPLFLYFVCVTYIKDKRILEKNRLLSLSLIFSILLISRYNYSHTNYYTSIIINIPLIIAYIKEKKLTAIFISMLLTIYYIINFNISVYVLLLLYITYYLIFVLSNKYNKSTNIQLQFITIFTSFKVSFMSFYIIGINSSVYLNVLNILISITVFYTLSISYYKMLIKIEDVINISKTIKDMQNDKMVRNALFKVVHEIKNPIAVCKGYLQMLDLNNKEKLQKYIPIIEEQINRMVYIMDDYLDYSKIKIEKDIIDIIMLIEDTYREMQELLRGKGVSLKLHILDDEVYMNADYNRLKQVLVNLIKNSSESKMDDAELQILIDTKLSNNKIQIIISDTGIGMTKDEIKHLGELFYTTKPRGTGVGVNLSKEIIQRHNGTLEYISKKYCGTDAIITLPIDNDLKLV